MKIEVQFDDMTPGKDLQERIQRRIAFALGIHRDRIKAVRVHLTRVNEPRDGKDKSCEVNAFLAAGQKVLVKTMDSDLQLAIHRAVDRAGWTVARRLQREWRQANHNFVTRKNSPSHHEPVWLPESPGYSANGNRH